MFMFDASFMEALLIIADDFMLLDLSITKEFVKPKKIKHVQAKADIRFTVRDWEDIDLLYWGRYGIGVDLLRYYRVSPVRALWLEEVLTYTYNKNDPAYAYSFSKEDTKVYFPNRSNARFLCNTNTLQGYEQLPEEGDILIVQKSYKDVIALYNFGYPAVSPQSETQPLTDEQYMELSARFTTIYSWYDYDATGIKTALKMEEDYGIKPIFLTDGTRPYGGLGRYIRS